MALAKIDVMGAPDYGTLKGKEGIVFHTPENTDASLEAAISTAKWQATSGNSSGGSYHGILAHDAKRGPMSDPNAWVLVKTVPFGHIAGSISTNRDPAIWQPGRFPWIAQLLSKAAYADPNAYLHALCLGGRAAWWSNKLSTPDGRAEVRGAIVAMARWVKRLEELFDYDAVLTLHRMWQTNRSDPDGLNFADLVLDEYAKIGTASADPGPAPEPVPAPEPTWAERIRARVTELEAALATANATIVSREGTIRRLRGRLSDVDTLSDAAIAAVAKIKEA